MESKDRQLVRQLLSETGWSQAQTAREIVRRYGYKVQPSEMCNAVNGTLDTPKARRILTDALGILSARKSLMDKRREKAQLALGADP